jgi:CubicO group peptidase (beta-lactamase class C family)
MRRLLLSALLAVGLLPPARALADAGRVEALLRREMRERRIPGLQVAVVRRGRIALLRSLGVANLQDSVPVGDRSVFAINSCTKAFTGVAVMQLVEEGELDLSAPASAYLGGLPAAWRAVTVRQLLTHVSGLPNILNVLDPATGKLTGRDDENAAWAKVQAMPLESPAGERFSYNQTNYVLLGKIIDKYAGQPFARFFDARQFRAAGMTNTLFGDSRDVIPRQAPSYRYVRNLDGHPLGEEKLVFSYAEFPPLRDRKSVV